MPKVDCPVSRDSGRAYLHRLAKSGARLRQMLLSWHNIAVYQWMLACPWAAVAQGTLAAIRERLAAEA